MSSPRVLHPSIRERREPRVSAAALASYLIGQPDRQESILHDARFAQQNIVAANQDALKALRAYNVDPRRDNSALERVKAALISRAGQRDLRPKARDEALRCKEAIELFQRSENALGLRGMALKSAPDFKPLIIEGVTVSVRPDFLRGGPGNKIGAGIIRVAKSPNPEDCKRETTRSRKGDERREMARYMIVLMHLLLDEQGREYGVPTRDLSFVADVRLGETIGCPLDFAARVRAIRAVCRQIDQLWDGIRPRPSLFKKKDQ
jgi:hypothetical protein